MPLSSDKLKLIPYETLVDPKDYWNLSIILLIIGFCTTSYFFMYFNRSHNQQPSHIHEGREESHQRARDRSVLSSLLVIWNAFPLPGTGPVFLSDAKHNKYIMKFQTT
jgi:hypothetical protein